MRRTPIARKTIDCARRYALMLAAARMLPMQTPRLSTLF
jgi:hypothetical protein